MRPAFALTCIRGLDAVQLLAPDGARATVLLHGAHLLSWVPVSACEQLYLSPKSAYAPGQAIRGGVPVIFPQFAGRGPLQHHGFARIKSWKLVRAEQGDDGAIAVLRLTDDASTRLVWPYRFELQLSIRIRGNHLDMELTCENKGEASFEFTHALHTYFRLLDLQQCSVRGLQGLHFWDSVGNLEKTQAEDLLAPKDHLDRIYHGLQQELLLSELRGETQRRLLISQQGFEDVVVWNPGIEKCAALADMATEGYKNMLCVEAANIIHPTQLSPCEKWSGTQSLSLL
jgi:glucose-6-phosphate 1-epimerase